MTTRICVLVTAALIAGGCGSTKAKPATIDPLTGPLTVLAAASLTEALNQAKPVLTAAHPGLALTYSFAGSQTLVTQVRNGAEADVFASADEASMQTLGAAGLTGPPVTMARNSLEIAVAPGNPERIAGLSDLARADLKVVLAAETVPAGRYARQALVRANVAVQPVSEPLDVKSALLTVTSGEADAAIVYTTDVAASGGKAEGVAITDSQNIVATYPIAVLTASKHAAAARAFVEAMVSGAGQQALRARGFQAP